MGRNGEISPHLDAQERSSNSSFTLNKKIPQPVGRGIFLFIGLDKLQFQCFDIRTGLRRHSFPSRCLLVPNIAGSYDPQ